MFKPSFFIVLLLLSMSVVAQREILSNASVIEMTAAGLSAEIITAKISASDTRFDVSTTSLVELKKAGVADDVIKLMMQRAETQLPGIPPRDAETRIATAANAESKEPGAESATFKPSEALASAKTIAFHKSSAQPSRQNLEKALLKNTDFKQMGLTIQRYKDDADLFVEIGYVSGSWITHRYVYRIYDRRSGAVMAAGETTSWGSLAENLARHITRSLKQVKGS